jgi:iron(III) transport system substrate-binding protein
MKLLYGWDFFKKLERNKPQIGRSINDTVTALNAGEREVAAGADGSTMFSAARGNPLSIVYPSDGAVLIIAPSAIVKGTKHPNAARLFMEYLYSIDAAKINVKHFGVPMRPEVPVAKGEKPVSEVKAIHPTVQQIYKGIPEAIEDWRDTFGN